MPRSAKQIFYILSGFALLVALFVLQPSQIPETQALQNEMKSRFAVAWEQVFGDQSYLEGVDLVYTGVTKFYEQSSDVMISYLAMPEVDQDLAYIFAKAYSDVASVFGSNTNNATVFAFDPNPVEMPVHIPVNYMSEEPIYNIVPSNLTQEKIATVKPVVAGAAIRVEEPVNIDRPWVTIQDNFTGQKYCVAIYNGEINKYLGSCKNDYQ